VESGAERKPFEFFNHHAFVSCPLPGEEVSIGLHGVSEELDVCLKPDSVVLENTFISLCSVRTVSLANPGNAPLRFCWKSWPSQHDEDVDTMR
jgi:hypothetical protein